MHPADGLPLLEICEPELSGPDRVVKSAFDRLASLLLIILLSPLLAAIAIAIKLNDGGPVFFRQRRIGKEGREFRIWKFRSMTDGASQVLRSVETPRGGGKVLVKPPGGRTDHVRRTISAQIFARRPSSAVQRADRHDVAGRPASTRPR
jgi:lipopolysaccharide/colanic/teichoic acid biosynthesis glycosyltransferase